MSEKNAKLSGPDLTHAIELSIIPDETMLAHAQGEPVLLTPRGDEVFAIGAICTHYGAPLEEGLLVGDTVRCPWHHAGFGLRTGEAFRGPTIDRFPAGALKWYATWHASSRLTEPPNFSKERGR
jgi:nitrite reductase/ring-hydroxylating ferredoxin subunit